MCIQYERALMGVYNMDGYLCVYTIWTRTYVCIQYEREPMGEHVRTVVALGH